MTRRQFPRVIYVKWEEAGEDEQPFVTAHLSPADASDQNETVKVGIYRLESIRSIVNQTRLR